MTITTKTSASVLFALAVLLAAPVQAHFISEAVQGSGVLLSEVTAVCDCIAKEESKRITPDEVRKFVIEGKYPASLMMKSNAATYTCLQAR